MSTTKTLEEILWDSINPHCQNIHEHLTQQGVNNWRNAANAVRDAVLADLPEWGLVDNPAQNVRGGDEYWFGGEWTPWNGRMGLLTTDFCRRRLRPAASVVEPLPAQAPEEQGKPHSDLITVNKFISLMECSVLFPEIDKYMTAVKEQRDALTRERDEARVRSEENLRLANRLADSLIPFQSRAESAEARVKVLEGELAEEQKKTRELFSMCIERQNELRELRAEIKASTSPTWIPVSTPPTEGDGRSMTGLSGLKFHGMVLWGAQDFCCIGHYDKKPDWATCWKHLDPLPLPPSTQTEDETERKAFEAWALSGHANELDLRRSSSGEYSLNDSCIAWLAWQAARQSTTKKD